MQQRRTSIVTRILAPLVLAATLTGQGSAPVHGTGFLNASPVNILEASVGTLRQGDDLYALGRHYFASFDASGLEFTSAMGDLVDTPARVRFTLKSIARGAVATFERSMSPAAHAEPRELDDRRTIIYTRGNVQEHYESRPDGIEQSFVFAQRPQGSGDLVVRLRLDTHLRAATGRGLRSMMLRDGTVDAVSIGTVTGIDADGRTTKGHMNYDGRDLELVLPASFVDEASYPMVLDPLIGTPTFVHKHVTRWPDISYMSEQQYYLAVWEQTLTSSGGNIIAGIIDAVTGRYRMTLVVAKYSAFPPSGPWRRPAVATLQKGSSWFYVVYEGAGIYKGGIYGCVIDVKDRSSPIIRGSSTVVPPAQNASTPDVGGCSDALIGTADPTPHVVYRYPGGIRLAYVNLYRPSHPTKELRGKVATPTIFYPVVRNSSATDPKITKSVSGSGKFLIAWDAGDEKLALRFMNASKYPNYNYGPASVARPFSIPNSEINDVQVGSDGMNHCVTFAWKIPNSSKWNCSMQTYRVPARETLRPVLFNAGPIAVNTATNQWTPCVDFVGCKDGGSVAVAAYTSETGSNGIWNLRGGEFDVSMNKPAQRIGRLWSTTAPGQEHTMPSIATHLSDGNRTSGEGMAIWVARNPNAIYAQRFNAWANAPRFSKQPTNTTLNLGYNAPRALLSCDSPNATSYQWWQNGNPITGQTKKELRLKLDDVTSARAGTYSCVIKTGNHACLTLRSTVVRVTVSSQRVTRWPGAAPVDQMWGERVLGVGDMDGDGYNDYAVSAPRADKRAGKDCGVVSFYSGRDRKWFHSVEGPVAGALLGTAMTSGDFDQDGYADVFIGSAGRHNGWNSTHYFLSGKTRRMTRAWADSNQIAQHMATGYFNADKYPDIVANFGSNRIQALGFQKGRLWWTQVGGDVGSLAVVNDRDGDGLNDILVGIPGYNNGAGRFELRAGSDGRLLTSQNGAAGDQLGSSVIGGGNMRGGWNFDFAVGSPGYNGDRGKVSFFDGWNYWNYKSITSTRTAGRFGRFLAAAGDQDGDGADDILVSGRGFVRLLRGKDGVLLRNIGGSTTHFGHSIACIDTNGDSKRDFIIGQPSTDSGDLWCYDGARRLNPPMWSRFGATCRGSGSRHPRIHGSSGSVSRPDFLGGALARSGAKVNIFVTNAARSSAAILRLGVQRTELPLDAIGMPGCVHQVQQIWSFVVGTDRNGAARFGPLSIPTDAKFHGVDLSWQWLVFDKNANRFGLTMSDSSVMRIGQKL